MATNLTPDEAIERARRLQDDRLNAVRVIAERRQAVSDVRAQAEREIAEVTARHNATIAEAEREDLRAFNAAIAAGWTIDELRKIGFAEPEKKARVRRARAKTTRRPAVETSADGSAE